MWKRREKQQGFRVQSNAEVRSRCQTDSKRGVRIIPKSANKWKRMHQTKGKRAFRREEGEGNMKGQQKGQKCVKQDKTQEKRESCKIKQEAAQADVKEAFCC